MEIRPGLHRIVAPLGERFIAMHLFVGSEASLLFDTGVDESVEGTLVPALEKIGFDPASLTWVISSHCDFDHTGGNAALAAIAPNATFLAGAADREMTENIDALISGRYGEFIEPDGFADPPETTALVRASTRLRRVDRALHGGEELSLGDRTLRVLAAPGHSPGHLAIWDADNRALVISDAILGDTVPTAAGDPAFPPTYRDTEPYLDTIEMARAHQPDVLLTAHYPVYEGAAVTAFLDTSAQYVEHIDRVLETYLRYKASPATTLEIIADTHRDLGPWGEDAAKYLIFPLTGNLERLTAQGRVRAHASVPHRTWEWIS